MELSINARHCRIPDTLRTRVAERIESITRLEPKVDSATVAFDNDHGVKRAEARVCVAGAQTIIAHDLIYGVSFQFTIPMQEYMGAGPDASAGLRAEWIQTMAQHAHVVGLSYTQFVNRQGGLTDQMIVTVGTPDGENEAEITLPLEGLNTIGAFDQVDALYAALAHSIGLAV